MIAILVSTGVSLLVALFGTPLFIRFLVKRNYGQFVRQDGPTAHFTKRGTPTMGGVVIIGATLIGVAAAMVVGERWPSATVWLALYLMTGLGVVGFADDFTKIRKQRSLGLTPRAKIIGQGFVGITFAILALQFPNANWRTPASTRISFLRDTNLDLAFAGTTVGLILFVIWANFLITAWSNAVNLTDGLDGLATGVSLVVFLGYVLVGIWQLNQSCQRFAVAGPRCYEVRDPQDIAIVAAAVVGACFGFLWWNASPAKIFMGDTGALALGGALAALSILSRTQILAAIIGGMFVIIVMSDVIQIGFFKMTRRRVFKMAPLHHHFELSGWGEVTIVIRFWLIAGLFAALGMGIFYAEWVVS
ncbi:phospho-N-acetylmuramoyl-pentapeptide-transferase [Xylanimonas cellulosilytica DSM 15894]|uniref:Phospho-N-acetylmuramoyl-pentapeptide-transferase n=1 Tax=Xylanimonas cellulosilytica (strain DSM 15894 / JCM 12276 / CECT 5975 / KCTC 9989 / LMG 20990 / NBRC 107835 / XIL07) TaxID=446471 RepID=D1C0C3_XYLCX|nr:phospho-N-acetylmuramoyl-pentapeptide-transferase [Xylanimonas cellulosilytica]ACZ30312.1 phospho-N-acetylmuramoyl-pentapeptide-transferase [Xylanimonas cellulosilytica DSM 15894]